MRERITLPIPGIKFQPPNLRIVVQLGLKINNLLDKRRSMVESITGKKEAFWASQNRDRNKNRRNVNKTSS